ncbi:MAG: carbohydrate-binding protein [Bacteroidaceae bacterium]|nr:carbohydrate-binding protein [Bacteroidaceae bacterium]
MNAFLPKNHRLMLLALATVFGTALWAQEPDAYVNDYDRTPTMGWSSWNTFGLNISESLIKSQANAMVSTGLSKAGYKYINIDDGFWNGRASSGKLRLNNQLFPSGMRSLTNYIHRKGLLAGIYSDAGDNTCGSGNTRAYGLGVGFYGHEEEDCQLYFNDWNFDFIKVDYCGGAHLNLVDSVQYTRISQAINRSAQELGKPIVFNICRWAYPGTWVNGICDSWRTTGDIYCAWESVKSIILENLNIQAYTSRGHYNDMDMLEIGRTLTHDEEVTHMAYWCICSSPLLIGCDLTKIPKASLELLKNADLIAMNQDTLGLGAPVVARKGDVYTVAKDVEKLRGPKRAVVIMNLGDKEASTKFQLSSIDMEGTALMHNCLTGEDTTIDGSMTLTIPAHGSAAFFVTGTRVERTRYQGEEAWMPLYQEIAGLPTARYESHEKADCGGYAAWLGNDPDNYMIWRDIYSYEGGKYRLAIYYASAESRNFDCYVNGELVRTFRSLNNGSWGDHWNSVSVNITLQPGQNTIRLGNDKAFAPNIDYIQLRRTGDLDGVAAPAATAPVAGDTYYNMKGQRVLHPRNGIYITPEGKKQLFR